MFSMQPSDLDRGTFFSPTVANDYQPYDIPSQAVVLLLMGCGGGNQGGTGFSGATATARGGGGGGATASRGNLWVPTIFLPKRIYVRVGSGQRLGVAATVTVFAIDPSEPSAFLMLCTVGNSGGNGTAAAGGAGGNPSTATAGNYALMHGGFFYSSLGVAGTTGGAQTGAIGLANGSATTLFLGGTGGAGVSVANAGFAGGSSTTIKGVRAGGAAGQPGLDGETLPGGFGPMYSLPGTGGGSLDGQGGRGGNGGGFGMGGGGGGAGITGGAGGNGGDGFGFILPLGGGL